MSAARILAVYSNPHDSTRLRLDQEQRAIDGVLARAGLPQSAVKRLQAASLEDLAVELGSAAYEVLQFSGHGESDGFVFERRTGQGSEVVAAGRLAPILRTAPSLRVLLLLSCFSSDALADLGTVAPYVVTMTGPAGDSAAIDFVVSFLQSYLTDRSVEKAFRVASSVLSLYEEGELLHPVLSRRAVVNGTPTTTYVIPGQGDSVLVNMQPVEAQLARLGGERETLLSSLSRKMRVHRWIFDQPRDRTVLGIGSYFGVFSWITADDPILCHALLRLRPDADEALCECWARLLVTYNDLAASRYRGSATPAGAEMERTLVRALRDQQRAVEAFFGDAEAATLLRAGAPGPYTTARAFVRANVEQAEFALTDGELERAVSYLEASLTAIHDLVDALSARLLMPADAAPSDGSV